MILEFDYNKKKVTIKGEFTLSELTKELAGKEDWKIEQSTITVKEYIYQYYPYNPVVPYVYEPFKVWCGNDYTTTGDDTYTSRTFTLN